MSANANMILNFFSLLKKFTKELVTTTPGRLCANIMDYWVGTIRDSPRRCKPEHWIGCDIRFLITCRKVQG